jgi:hypothetical protein
LAIEPASIVFDTVPVSPVVTTIPVTAGNVIVPEAAAVATTVVVPDDEPAIVNPADPMAGLTSDRPETLVVVPPRVSVLEPSVTVAFASFALAIEPASIALVTDPVSPDPTRVPEVVGSVNVVVPAVACATRVDVPEVEPLNIAPEEMVGVVSVSPATVVTVFPRVTEVDPIVTDEDASLLTAMAAPEAMSAFTIDPEIVILSQDELSQI